jgi:hypothetical protein
MPFVGQTASQDAVTSEAEFESLVARVVELTITRINGPTLKPFLTSRECAELIGVTPVHLCAMRARGEGPPWSGSGKWVRYERNAVLNWLANLPQQPSASSFNRLIAATSK